MSVSVKKCSTTKKYGSNVFTLFVLPNAPNKILNFPPLQAKKTNLKNARLSFKIAPNEAWNLAVAESDVLSFVSIEHRLDFYKEILT